MKLLLNVPEDFFGNRKVKKLRKYEDGDTYIIIYLKMMLISLENDGSIYREEFSNTRRDFIEEIALDIDEELGNVNLVVNYLEQMGLIRFIDSGEISFTNLKWVQDDD